jgi:Lon-like ATP-dependent protease
MTNVTSSSIEKHDFKSYKSSGDIEIPDRIIDQIIGQEEAVATVIKAAKQRRNVLLIGEPGIGKSMLAKGMAELLPPEELQDILVYPNVEDNNNPLIGAMPAGEGKKVVDTYRVKVKSQEERKNMFMIAIIGAILAVGFLLKQYLTAIIAAGIVLLIVMQIKPRSNIMVPKLLVNNENKNTAPFVDATGSHAGALLGDVRHDPYQSGGLGTPAHERVEAGMIHKSNKGVLYIDEIGTMQMKTQQELLTAMQGKKYSITGQSESSSGAMVRSNEVPCDFVLVASGNLQVLKGMHIALRSRIRGYGYEVFMKDSMKDTMENKNKLIQFIAQEVKKDGRIPHFSSKAVEEIIHEAQRRTGKKDELTLKLRDLGGLVRAAGDIAKGEGADIVTLAHVITGKKLARTLEQQVADRYIDQRKTYSVFKSVGSKVGIVNGLAIIGDRSGILLPIAAEAAPAQSKDEGKIIATGKLGEIAKEAVQNVSALIKKNTGTDISNHDIHIQFLQSYEGIEGDSASVSIATAVISALENVPVDQSVALTGSLSVRGDVMPVGGVTGKIEAAVQAGMKKVIIPESNMDDVLIEERYRDKIQIIPVQNMSEVLENALIGNGKDGLVTKMKKITNIVSKDIIPKPPKPTIN